ncbi:MAG: hypothetical protein RL111_861 [Pseudomonadota bacterium]|jgi:phospholipid transport system substrate-binding protein
MICRLMQTRSLLERVALGWGACLLALGLAMPSLHAQTLSPKDTPDVFISKLSNHLLEIVKSDAGLRAGDLVKINALVNDKVAPHVNFERMTASAVGPAWRQATPEQRKQLIEEFKLLLVRSYSGALSQVKDQKLVVKRSRFAPEDTEVVIRTEVVGGPEPIPIEYRLEKAPDHIAGWRIFNFNVMGVWLVETYRSQFGQIISSKGIEGLIKTLRDRNQSNAK